MCQVGIGIRGGEAVLISFGVASPVVLEFEPKGGVESGNWLDQAVFAHVR